MASIQKTKTGYRVQLSVKGVRTSATFPTRRECVEWAAGQVNAIQAPAEHKTFRDLLEKYRDEITPGKKGSRWEEIRINKILTGEARELAGKMVGSIGKGDIVAWRDRKLAAGLCPDHPSNANGRLCQMHLMWRSGNGDG